MNIFLIAISSLLKPQILENCISKVAGIQLNFKLVIGQQVYNFVPRYQEASVPGISFPFHMKHPILILLNAFITSIKEMRLELISSVTTNIHAFTQEIVVACDKPQSSQAGDISTFKCPPIPNHK
ncbi:hypothetical protein AMTRI_Chr11g152460 [Amborella trichopoda]